MLTFYIFSPLDKINTITHWYFIMLIYQRPSIQAVKGNVGLYETGKVL